MTQAGGRMGSQSTTMDQFPRVNDEPVVAIKLYGRNLSEHVRLHGWTHDFPVDFPGLPVRLKIKPNVDDPPTDDGLTLKEVEQREVVLARQPTTLLDMHNQAWPSTTHIIVSPVRVMVLAKKKIDCIVKNETCLLFATILVADEEGNYCVLDLVNDTIAALYEEVQLGDGILIAGGTYFKNDGMYGPSPFIEDKLLHLGIKPTAFHCRYIYRIRDADSAAFPKILTQNKKLWLPADLYLKGTSDIRSFETLDPQFIDVIGVVSHVGRMERLNRYSCRADYVLDNGQHEQKLLLQYTVFRWIEIVDEVTATPVPVKIYVNNNTWDAQKRIVPGALIVITLAMKADVIFGYDHITTTRFSEIYMNENIIQFIKLSPADSLIESARRLLGSRAPNNIVNRKDVNWSVGGSYSQPFRSEQKFADFYHERRNNDALVPLVNTATFPMERRETKYLFFKGEIIQHRPVVPGISPKWTWTNSEMVNKFSAQKCTKVDVIIPDTAEDDWYVFTRGLPPPEHKPRPKGGGKVRVYQDISEANAKYCGPLLMPASDDPSLKELPVIDGIPHFVVDIVNHEVQDNTWNRYMAVWKPSRHLNFEKMENKLEASKEKPVLIFMEIHRVETFNVSEYGAYEFILHDFTTILETQNPTDVDSQDEFNSCVSE